MRITYDGAPYDGAEGEAVLDTLLRHGVQIANSCRAAACQSCLLKATCGTVPSVAQRGLKSTLIEQGYFLSCACIPDSDLTIEPATGIEVDASIVSLEPLTASVLRARLRTAGSIAYRPGQDVTLCRPDGLSRSYSLASLPDDDTLELHVRLAPQGRMSGWLFTEARAGDAITLRGPAGDCFYTAGKPDQPLILAGTGTGLAPLVGICRDALRQGHTGPIHLYHGARSADGLYLHQELGELSRTHPNLHYSAVTPADDTATTADALARTIAERHASMAGWRAFVCGNPAAVTFLKRKLFMAGISGREIFADAFLEAPRPAS